MIEGAFELQPSSADKRRTREERNGRVGRNKHRGFADDLIADLHFAGHDCALGLLAASEVTPFDENDIEPGVFLFFSHPERSVAKSKAPVACGGGRPTTPGVL